MVVKSDPRPKLLDLIPITVKAGKTFRGTTCFQPVDFDCSFQYAVYCVNQGVADWNGPRFLKMLVADIKADIRAEKKLMRCKSFGDLHDVCDANCLGGLCEPDHPIWKICPGIDNPPPGVDGTAGRFVGGMDVVADAQDAVDAWIKAGHPAE